MVDIARYVDPVELIGYLASALIVLSFMMTSVVRLRIVSFIGCVAFITYGLQLSAWPVVISNSIIAVINAQFVYREFRSKRDLAMVPIEQDAPFLVDFIDSRISDIQHMQPGFKLTSESKVWLLTRDGLPTGLLAGRVADDCLHIDLDYVTPRFRDSRMGQFIYGEGSKTLKALGIRKVSAVPGSVDFAKYLKAMHFNAEGDVFSRTLD